MRAELLSLSESISEMGVERIYGAGVGVSLPIELVQIKVVIGGVVLGNEWQQTLIVRSF